MNIIRENLKWIILFICLVLFVEIVEDIFQNDIYQFDQGIYTVIDTFINPAHTAFFRIITRFGDWMIIIPTCFLCMIFLKEKRNKGLIIINLVTIFIINQLLKIIFNRPRPIENRLVEASGYSFPSGHSMISMAFYGFFIYLVYKYVKNISLYFVFVNEILVIFLIDKIYKIDLQRKCHILDFVLYKYFYHAKQIYD